MSRTIGAFLVSCFLLASAADAQIPRVAEMNSVQLRALDRAKTVVFLTGGMLEEHGPYLPSFTDGILSDRLTSELAQALIARKPGWTATAPAADHRGRERLQRVRRARRLPGHLRRAPLDPAIAHLLKILDGADPRQFPRYADLLRKNPLFRAWIESGQARDAQREARQREWLAKRRPDYSRDSESSRSFAPETMRSRPSRSRKTLRRPAPARGVLNGAARRSTNDKPEQRFSGLQSGFRRE